MKYRLIRQDNRLSVQIDEASGQEAAFLQKIHQCRQGAWACPSGECLNIGSIEERVEEGSVILTIIPRPGAQLNLAGIEECLGYMLREAAKTQ